MRQEKKQACFLVPYKRFRSFFSLYIWEPILSEVVITQKYLQQKNLVLIQCVSKIPILDDFLQRQRESLVADTVAKAKDICEEMRITTEQRIRRKRRMPGEEADDAGFTLEEELRREMLDCLDSLSQEIHQVSAKINVVDL